MIGPNPERRWATESRGLRRGTGVRFLLDGELWNRSLWPAPRGGNSARVAMRLTADASNSSTPHPDLRRDLVQRLPRHLRQLHLHPVANDLRPAADTPGQARPAVNWQPSAPTVAPA